MLPKLEAEARERVVEAARTKWGGNISVPFDGQGEARQQAAALLGLVLCRFFVGSLTKMTKGSAIHLDEIVQITRPAPAPMGAILSERLTKLTKGRRGFGY